MKHSRALTVGALIAGALVVSACAAPGSTPASPAPTSAALLTIGSLQEPASWDPAMANEGHQVPIYQSVYDTLIKREPDGSLAPMLATSWSMSDDGLQYTLELRDDVTFTDGAEFDAAAAKSNLEHFRTSNGPFKSSLDSVSSIEATDASTLVLTLSAPDPDLLLSLSRSAGFMASPDALASGEIDAQPIGSGPYILDEGTTVAGSQIVFDRNEEYWGAPLPYDSVEFSILPDETARLNALSSGEVDAALLNRASSGEQAVASGLRITDDFTVDWLGVLFFDRDGQLLPELADPRVREALSLAIDRDAILDVAQLGAGEATTQVFGPSSGGFDADLDDAYPFDPDRARELLSEAGAEDLAFTLPISPVFDPVIYDAIEQNWKDVGVTIERHAWAAGEPIPSMQRGEWPLSVMSLPQRSDWGTVRYLLRPGAPWNPFHTTAPELEEMIAQLQTAPADDQQSIAQQINEWVVENHWFAPIMRPDVQLVFNDTVDVQPQVEQIVPSIYNYRPAQ